MYEVRYLVLLVLCSSVFSDDHVGYAKRGSISLHDSFRYIPEDGPETTVTEINKNGKNEAEILETAIKNKDCVIYDFEQNFGTLFRDDLGLCATVHNAWTLGQYSIWGLNSPDPNSQSFIMPRFSVFELSCTSSFSFNMSAYGILEINIFKSGLVTPDSFILLQVTFSEEGGVEQGTTSYYERDIPDGWSVLRAAPNTVTTHTEQFYGYVTFSAHTVPIGTFLIDSFQYIPLDDEKQCLIYGDTGTIAPEQQTTTYTESPADEPILTTTPTPFEVLDEDCVTYDFEQNFDTLFRDDLGLCATVHNAWTLGQYSIWGLNSPDPNSQSFIMPRFSVFELSCTSSFSFNMSAHGILEINIFKSGLITPEPFILLQVIFSEEGGVEQGTTSFYEQDIPDGWSVLRATPNAVTTHTGQFYGFVTFSAHTVPIGTFLIDSFQYIPLDDEKQCLIYGDTGTIAPEQQTTTYTERPADEPILTTTPTPFEVLDEDCVTYDFEQNFDTLFRDDLGLCATVHNAWTLGQYSIWGLNSPDPNSQSFIMPRFSVFELSCTSSFSFNMSAHGILEINIFKSGLITPEPFILLQVIFSEEGGVEQGTTSFYEQDIPDGWSVLRATPNAVTTHTGQFYGFVTFSAQTVPIGRFLIDSFQYIPLDNDEKQCIIYGDTGTTAPPTNPETTVTETTPTTTETSFEVLDEDCVTYDFEQNFDTLFRDDLGLCATVHNAWTLGQYSIWGLNSPDPNSQSFIMPRFSVFELSCTSSFSFNMSAHGILEINIFKSGLITTELFILLQVTFSEEGGVEQGTTSFYEQDIPDGWSVLRAAPNAVTTHTGQFYGYVTFSAHTVPIGTFLIDSFRYIPLDHDEKQCLIYGDPGTTVPTIKPETTPTETTETPTTVAITETTDPMETTTDPATYLPATETTTDSTMESTTVSTTDSTTNAKTEPDTYSTTEIDSTIEPTIDTTSDLTTESTETTVQTTESTVDSKTVSTTVTASDPTTETETRTDPTTETTTKTTTGSTSVSTIEPTTRTSDPITELTTNPTADSKTEPTVDPTEEPTTHSTTELTKVPITESPTQPIEMTTPTDPEIEKPINKERNYWILIAILIGSLVLLIIIISCIGFCCYLFGRRNHKTNERHAITIINNSGHQVLSKPDVNI